MRAPAIAQLCTLGAATSNQRPAHEFDVQLRVSPDSAPWTLGPALPTSAQYDFESNVLHELGHISGLAHQIDPCDPSTPMPSGQKNGEFWQAVDEWRRGSEWGWARAGWAPDSQAGPRPAVTATIAPEIDLRINEVSVAWELGPKFPVDGTRWDLETALLQNIMSSAGVAAGTASGLPEDVRAMP